MIWQVVKRELQAHIHSLTFWLVLSATQLIITWLLFAQLEVYARISTQLIAASSNLGINDLVVTPTLNSLATLLLFIVPLLGMNSLSSERQSGRLALFLSTPLSSKQLLLGKWIGTSIAGFGIALISILTVSSLSLGMQLDVARLTSSTLTLTAFIGFCSAIVVMFSSFSQQGSSALAASYALLLLVWLLDTLAPNEGATHWLALNPHLEAGFSGLIHSTHLLYFILLSIAALTIAWLRLKADRNHEYAHTGRWSLFLGLLLACTFFAGQLSTKISTHSQLANSGKIPTALQQSLEALEGPVIVTAYAPDYPLLHARIHKLISPLQALYPALELRFIDPQKQPHLVAGQGIGHEGELVIEGMQQRQHVRQLNYQALQKALARLARQGEPWIVALRGYGEADIYNTKSDGLSAFSKALQQQGYKTLSLNPLNTNSIPHNAAAVLVAANSSAYPAAVTQLLQRYLKQGGRIIWLHEGVENSALEKVLGVQTLPGKVVDAAAQRASLESPTQVPLNDFPSKLLSRPPEQYAVLHNSVALQTTPNNWQIAERLTSSHDSWNETGSLHGKISRQPMLGEQTGPLNLILALQHDNARAIVIGDSDFVRNAQFGQHGNRALILGLVNWLTENSALPTAQAADDIQINWSTKTAAIVTIVNLIFLPMLFFSIGLIIRRRRLAA